MQGSKEIQCMWLASSGSGTKQPYRRSQPDNANEYASVYRTYKSVQQEDPQSHTFLINLFQIVQFLPDPQNTESITSNRKWDNLQTV